MKSRKLGSHTSGIDLHTSPFGLWLLIDNVEYFLSYRDYPWFMDAKISDLYDIRRCHTTHLYWPALDVDLDLDIISNPEKYPLASKS